MRAEAEARLREDVQAASRAKLDALEAVRRAREAHPDPNPNPNPNPNPSPDPYPNQEDAAMLLHERFPVPMYVECDQYGSQARLGIGLGLGY